MICDNISRGEDGVLRFAGQSVIELAEKYATPAYLVDEDKLRENCRVYTQAFQQHFNGRAKALYASKANSFKRIYEIVNEENMGIDVVSGGEIYTASIAGYPMEKAYFHGNNKTDEEIELALKLGVGCFVIDNEEELCTLENIAAKHGIKQKALLRLTPGIDPHTYEAASTGKVDSKFGVAIETGQAEQFVVKALNMPHIELAGFHCHVGSQVFAEDVFERAAVIMLRFASDIRDKYGYVLSELDLGGGYGVRYVDTDPYLDVSAKIAQVAAAIKSECAALNLPIPEIIMEPGRAIVADAGMTLYTVGAVKHIPGYKTYVSIDGGMGDDPRYALYRSQYTCLAASQNENDVMMKCTLAGKCCESGDIIQEDIYLPEGIKKGDVVAVCTTGAYNYSMASNYNRVPRPPIVMLHGGESYLAVRRESLEDICRNDL
jgi:diaminopimelate decarboxylase